jgi:plastocyanin
LLRTRLGAFVATASGVAGAVAGAAIAADEVLQGVVGPGSTIALVTSAGAPVSRLEPGTYQFQIRDLSDEHNFHLSGPGVNEATTVEGLTETTWTVTLQSGTYTFLCDPHSRTMNGRFAVGSPSTDTGGGSSSTTAVALAGLVGPRAISITKGGAKVARLTAGRVRLTVRDRTSAGNLHLTGPGVNRKTSVAGTGTTTWSLTLKPGTYVYRSDKDPKLRGSFVVRAA